MPNLGTIGVKPMGAGLSLRSSVVVKPWLSRHKAGRGHVDGSSLMHDDAVGQTSALVDARGNRHSFMYDSTGAQTQLIDPANRGTTSAYLCKGPAGNDFSGI